MAAVVIVRVSHGDLVEILAGVLRAMEPDVCLHNYQNPRERADRPTRTATSTAPTRNATAQEKPLPTPRIRVGYISAVYVVTGPHTPINPHAHAMPRSHRANVFAVKIQSVMKIAASSSRIAKPGRRPKRSIIQPPTQKPVVANKAQQM